MLEIKKIDRFLNTYNEKIKAEAEQLKPIKVCEFDMTKKGIKDIPYHKFDYPGIYFIHIKNNALHQTFESWAKEFVASWTHEQYKGKFVPNPKKIRIKQHLKLKSWIPLYIGKSKNISKRISEHIHLEMDQKTYALKLKHRDHLKNDRFKISTIQVDVQNYDWIMPVLEQALRDKYNPIIGRQ